MMSISHEGVVSVDTKRIYVVQCPHCYKVKRYGEWIEPPMELVYAIADETINTISKNCDDCKSQRTSPVVIHV